MRARFLISLLTGLCILSSGCEDKCDIPSAVARAGGFKPVPLNELTLGLKSDARRMTLVPAALSIEQTEGVLVKQGHLSSGARIQILDAEGKVIHEDNIPNPLAARETIGSEVLRAGAAAEIAELDRWMQTQSMVIPFPRLAQAVTARVLVQNPAEDLASLRRASSSSPAVYDFRIADIPHADFSTLEEQLLADGAKVTPLHYSGNAHNRLNIVILSDGYRDEELGRYRGEAEQLKNDILSTVPYSEYPNYVNVWSVEIPSRESGARCDDKTANARKNRFGTVFPVACINATFKTKYNDRFIMQTAFARVIRAAKLVKENGKSVPAQIFVLTNSPKSGGTALFWASQSNVTPPYVITHELGHSFGGLADEYVVKGDPCLLFNLFKPNISFKKSKAEKVKWSRWIEPGTPIPTPDEAPYSEKIGLFKGASDCTNLFYRPSRTCKMKTNNGTYCKVCLEQIMLRLYDYVHPIEGPLEIVETRKGVYRVSGRILKSDLVTQWFLDGKQVSATPRYSPVELELKPGAHKIALAVRDASSYVRRDQCHLFDARAVAIQVPRSQ